MHGANMKILNIVLCLLFLNIFHHTANARSVPQQTFPIMHLCCCLNNGRKEGSKHVQRQIDLPTASKFCVCWDKKSVLINYHNGMMLGKIFIRNNVTYV